MTREIARTCLFIRQAVLLLMWGLICESSVWAQNLDVPRIRDNQRLYLQFSDMTVPDDIAAFLQMYGLTMEHPGPNRQMQVKTDGRSADSLLPLLNQSPLIHLVSPVFQIPNSNLYIFDIDEIEVKFYDQVS